MSASGLAGRVKRTHHGVATSAVSAALPNGTRKTYLTHWCAPSAPVRPSANGQLISQEISSRRPQLILPTRQLHMNVVKSSNRATTTFSRSRLLSPSGIRARMMMLQEMPCSALSPEECVRIQLNALKDNDSPWCDHHLPILSPDTAAVHANGFDSDSTCRPNAPSVWKSP